MLNIALIHPSLGSTARWNTGRAPRGTAMEGPGARNRNKEVGKVYRFSRSIYRELSPRVIESHEDPPGGPRKQRVLDACEATMRRPASDPRYFPRPTKTLFSEIRCEFSMNDQLHVYTVV